MLDIHSANIEDQILLWKILGGMTLSHLALDFVMLKSQTANKEKLIRLYQKCWTITGIQSGNYYSDEITTQDILILSYFPSLNYFYVSLYDNVHSTIAQNVIKNCNNLRCASFLNICYNPLLLMVGWCM